MNNPKILKTIIIVAALFQILIWVAFYFIFVDIKNRNYNISTLNDTLSTQIKKQNYMLSMDRIIKDTDSDLIRVNNSFIKKGGDVDFIEDMEDIAKGNGLSIKIDSLSYEENPALASNGLTILKVTSNMSGKWTGIYSFLFQLESLPLKVRIDKFSLNQNIDTTSASSSRQWQAALEISVSKYK